LHAARIAHLFLAVGIILALFATVLHKPGMATQSSWWDAYHEKLREFLRHPLGKAALAGVVLLGILCVITRLPWMLELRQHDTVSIGTGIYDDMRTIGFPIALAVKGFPLLSPYATTVGLHYPMGGFFFTGGVIATLHGNPLLPIQADIFVSVLFLVLTLLLVTVSVISQPSLRFLALLSMLITTAFDHRLIKHGWNERLFHFLYGYGIERPDWQTTLTWTTYTALLWLLNHAVAAVALLFIISLLAPGEEVLLTFRRGYHPKNHCCRFHRLYDCRLQPGYGRHAADVCGTAAFCLYCLACPGVAPTWSIARQPGQHTGDRRMRHPLFHRRQLSRALPPGRLTL